MEGEATAKEVARWMMDELESRPALGQQWAANQIRERFGERFVYRRQSGNLGIREDVLAAFRGLYRGVAKWERGDKAWRLLREHELPDEDGED